MKIGNIKTIKIEIENFEPFEFNYEQLADFECKFEEESTIIVTIKPREYDSRLEEN